MDKNINSLFICGVFVLFLFEIYRLFGLKFQISLQIQNIWRSLQIIKLST